MVGPREPAISNWRRGLQAELVSRLAELSSGKSGMPGPTRNALHHAPEAVERSFGSCDEGQG